MPPSHQASAWPRSIRRRRRSNWLRRRPLRPWRSRRLPPRRPLRRPLRRHPRRHPESPARDIKSDSGRAGEYPAPWIVKMAKPIVAIVGRPNVGKSTLFNRLGMGEPAAVSGIHGHGLGDLLDQVVVDFPKDEVEEVEEGVVRLAIVGRPNVGKSSLVNSLVGENRVMVSKVPGTTRDAVDTPISYQGTPVVLVDTAGIRRRGRVEKGIEKFSVLRAVQAVERADVAALLIDADEGLTAQDAHVAGYVVDAAKGMVLVVNKWDLVRKDTN